MTLRTIFRVIDLFDLKRFEFPVCVYTGPFRRVWRPSERRKYVRCPKCGAFERHLLQFLVFEELSNSCLREGMRVLLFAPEDVIRKYLFQRVDA